MKLAILGESAADEAAIRILVNGVIGIETETVAGPELRSRGWPSVQDVLKPVLKHLHYQTDADAFVIVVDSNHSPLHLTKGGHVAYGNKACRNCLLTEIIDQTRQELRPRSGRVAIKTAIGIAIPSIEAWYRCGQDPHITEASWIQSLESRNFPYTKRSLKFDVYGTDRPSLQTETERAVKEAHRLTQALNRLEMMFPNGFGTFAKKIRNW